MNPWRAQTTMPTPVAAYPFENFVLAWDIAAKPVQVLIYRQMTSELGDEAKHETHVFLVGVLQNVLAVGHVFDEITQPASEGRVALVARYSAPFQPEIRVDRYYKSVDIPIKA